MARGKRWFITVQAKEDDRSTLKIDELLQLLDTKYYAWVVEKKTSLHFHLFVVLEKRVSDSTLKRHVCTLHPGCEWDVSTVKGNNKQAREYIYKQDGTKTEEPPVENGELPKPGPTSEKGRLPAGHAVNILRDGGISGLLEEAPEMVLRFPAGIRLMASTLEEAPTRTSMTVTVIYGAAGVGKSVLSEQLAEEHDGGVYHHTKVGGSANTSWFDGYRGERTLIMDDFTGRSATHGAMLKIMGTDPFRVEMKGSSTWAHWDNVIITSNLSPWQWYAGFWADQPDDVRKAFFRRIHKIFKATEGTHTDSGITVSLVKLKDVPGFIRRPDFRATSRFALSLDTTAQTEQAQAEEEYRVKRTRLTL